MGLRDLGATLPPGFRFYPSDEELVCHYLYKKITNQEVLKGTLMEIDLHTCEPWQLPEVAKLNSQEWYFFSFRDRKYATGYRTNRATTSGYWKATGKDRTVHDPRSRAVVGMRKTLVFYRNRAPNGIKTGWIMHEFRLENPHMPPKEDWVLCRVFHKSKAENSNKLSPQYVSESTIANTSSNLAASPPTNQDLASGYHHQLLTSFSPTPSYDQTHPNLDAFNTAHLQLSSELQANDNAHVAKINSDDYGFFFNMGGFEESSSLGNGVPPNLEGLPFDDENSLVFL